MKGFRTRLSGPVSLSSIQNSTKMVSLRVQSDFTISSVGAWISMVGVNASGYVRLVCIPVKYVHACMCYVTYRCSVRFKMCSIHLPGYICVV